MMNLKHNGIFSGVSEDQQQHFHEPGAGSEDIPTLRQGERHKSEDDITIYNHMI